LQLNMGGVVCPLIRLMMFVTYCPFCVSGSLSGVSNGVTLSVRLFKTLAGTEVPALPRVGAVFLGWGGGVGLASLARLARAFSIAFSIAG
jgi:hypothetical protein